MAASCEDGNDRDSGWVGTNAHEAGHLDGGLSRSPDAHLKVVAVRRGHPKREVLDARVQQVEGDGGDHRAAHGGSGRAREQADAEEGGARNLRRRRRHGPEGGRAREEPEELGDDVGREAVDVLRAGVRADTLSGR